MKPIFTIALLFHLTLLTLCAPLLAGHFQSRPSNPPLAITATVVFHEQHKTEPQSETHTFHWYGKKADTEEINVNDTALYHLIFSLNKLDGKQSTFFSFVMRNDNQSARASKLIEIPLDKDSEATPHELHLDDNNGKITLTIATKVNQ
jgi:hypothetical protein